MSAPNTPVHSFPTQIEPFKWAELGFTWNDNVPLSRFVRVSKEAASSVEAQFVHVNCRLYIDDYHRRIAWLDGTLQATVPMTCQRCLEVVNVPLESQVHLALLQYEDQAERLDEDADFVILSEEQIVHGTEDTDHAIDLIELLEDELLLSMPISPRHESCEHRHQPAVQEEPVSKRDNPFEVLASLKGKLG
jgi:uncharacterized protein